MPRAASFFRMVCIELSATAKKIMQAVGKQAVDFLNCKDSTSGAILAWCRHDITNDAFALQIQSCSKRILNKTKCNTILRFMRRNSAARCVIAAAAPKTPGHDPARCGASAVGKPHWHTARRDTSLGPTLPGRAHLTTRPPPGLLPVYGAWAKLEASLLLLGMTRED
jgi:hypothetical protein